MIWCRLQRTTNYGNKRSKFTDKGEGTQNLESREIVKLPGGNARREERALLVCRSPKYAKRQSKTKARVHCSYIHTRYCKGVHFLTWRKIKGHGAGSKYHTKNKYSYFIGWLPASACTSLRRKSDIQFSIGLPGSVFVDSSAKEGRKAGHRLGIQIHRTHTLSHTLVGGPGATTNSCPPSQFVLARKEGDPSHTRELRYGKITKDQYIMLLSPRPSPLSFLRRQQSASPSPLLLPF